MANLGAHGDLSGAEYQEKPGLLPAAWYDFHITGSDVGATKSGGTMAKFELTVLDGPYRNRKVFWNINLANANPQATKIGQDQLLTLATNCGHPNPHNIGDTEELHGRPFRGLVGIEVGKDKGDGTKYDDRNNIKGTAKLEGAATSAPAPAATAPKPPSAPTAPVAPPAPPAPPQDAAMAAAGF